MKRATLFLRGGRLIISEISDENTPVTIGQRMLVGGFLLCADSYWNGKQRDIVINLSDVSVVILETIEGD